MNIQIKRRDFKYDLMIQITINAIISVAPPQHKQLVDIQF